MHIYMIIYVCMRNIPAKYYELQHNMCCPMIGLSGKISGWTYILKDEKHWFPLRL